MALLNAWSSTSITRCASTRRRASSSVTRGVAVLQGQRSHQPCGPVDGLRCHFGRLVSRAGFVDGDLHSGALIAGILILLIPRLLNYIVAIYTNRDRHYRPDPVSLSFQPSTRIGALRAVRAQAPREPVSITPVFRRHVSCVGIMNSGRGAARRPGMTRPVEILSKTRQEGRAVWI
jgi:hypothetical protein